MFSRLGKSFFTVGVEELTTIPPKFPFGQKQNLKKHTTDRQHYQIISTIDSESWDRVIHQVTYRVKKIINT